MSGQLIYLMGPSGAGKDSLLAAARPLLKARGCQIARRVITRSAEASGEDAIAVSAEQFREQEQLGHFAMSWRANGLAYGIPRQIDRWLAAGDDVLVNGSRGYLPEARQRYPQLLTILLTVAPEVLRMRLLARGRETLSQIDDRLARNASFVEHRQDLQESGVILLDNSSELEFAVQRLLALLDGCRRA